MAKHPVKPEFTLAQTKAVRVALSYAAESEDGAFVRVVNNAWKELDRAQREARNAPR